MSEVATAARAAGIVARAARSAAFGLTLAFAVWLLLWRLWQSPRWLVLLCGAVLALAATAAFALFGVRPRRLPRWIRRWVLQVVAVGVSVPVTAFLIHRLDLARDAAPLLTHHDGLLLAVVGALVAPWTALAAIIRRQEALARHQHLAFALERSELERQALDARLRLLQAQVAPHFLFNTLANVQALVDAGSPRASTVLRSLVAYLRAAVPLLDEPAATVERELELVRPYLELMRMRLPDRFEYALRVDPSALGVLCPPTTLLTLVENAVRHGIDPSEEGGRIDVEIARCGERCSIRVADTGVGLAPGANGLGTGLATLRERLHLVFGDAAELHLVANAPRGVAVEVDLPART